MLIIIIAQYLFTTFDLVLEMQSEDHLLEMAGDNVQSTDVMAGRRAKECMIYLTSAQSPHVFLFQVHQAASLVDQVVRGVQKASKTGQKSNVHL